MEIKIKRTNFPAAMRAAVAGHAAAMVAGDAAGAASWLDAAAAPALSAAIARTAQIRPWSGYEVIAEARLGFQYIVKVRYTGAGGSVTMQGRWACAGAGAEDQAGAWRMVEVEDLSVTSPWKRPPEADLARQAARIAEKADG